MYFVVTLALKILIYALVNCGFSGFAGLKLHLFIQPPVKWGWLSGHPHPFYFVKFAVR